MDEAYWQKLQNVFDEAVEIAPTRQAAFLVKACHGDEAMQEDLQGLLQAHVDVDQNWSQAAAPSSPMLGLSTPCQDGDEIGHYKIVTQIGAGGMGVVYQAYDSRLQRHVALKFLPAFLDGDKSCRERFMAEARAASKLDHPNICVIHDINETPEGHMYITMPHYEGETLSARLKRGRIPVEDALSICIQVAEGLSIAHNNGIIHRDIKPANIMLVQDGSVKILDFGIAKVENVNLTRTGMGVGTLAYMAPEQIHGKDVDVRVDVWALGVTLYEMLTGLTAFEGNGASQVVQAVLNSEGDPANSINQHNIGQHVPDVLQGILLKAMQRDRDLRYERMSLFLNDCSDLHNTVNNENNVTRQAAHLNRSNKTAFAWDQAFLDSVIEILTPILGPVTARLVSRQAKRSNDVEALCSALCEMLPDDSSRKVFATRMKLKASMNTTPPSPNAIKVSNPSAQLELSPLQLANIETILLPCIGPIAGSLIRRALATTSDWDEVLKIFTDSLAETDDKIAITKEIKAVVSG